MAARQPYSFTVEFIQRLQSQTLQRRRSYDPARDLPRYDAFAPDELDRLITHCTPRSFHVGTGASLYSRALLPAILSARHEVVLVTCFWAESPTLTALRLTLEELAARRKGLLNTPAAADDHVPPPLRVTICFSSRSFFQRLFHTSSRDGYVYHPASWSSNLGLPDARLLADAGINLRVKSLFFLPFSVMHPKFVIVDRERAFVPSCNVSWEAWLEGCVEIEGEAVECLYELYRRTWQREEAPRQQHPQHPQANPITSKDLGARLLLPENIAITRSPTDASLSFDADGAVTTIFLPSSHRRNPRFRPLPWHDAAAPFPTPLNVALLQLLDNARHSVYMQTPNLTSPPVLDALLKTLNRGVDVTIITSRNMMLLEQLVTAGTTTTLCLRRLIRRYKTLVPPLATRRHSRKRPGTAFSSEPLVDLEAQTVKPGRLRILYFRTPGDYSDIDRDAAMEEPVHSHLKLTIVDDEYTVLGSGNMDRASWYTSQELGILFHGQRFAEQVKGVVAGVLEGRLSSVFDSAG